MAPTPTPKTQEEVEWQEKLRKQQEELAARQDELDREVDRLKREQEALAEQAGRQQLECPPGAAEAAA